MKLKRIALLSLATLMVVSAFTGCAKKTEADRVSREVLQTPITTPDNIDNDNTVQYKKQLYFQDTKNGNEYTLGFTEDEYFLTVISDRNGYRIDIRQSTGEYTVDDDGNYILDTFLTYSRPLYFLDNLVETEAYSYSYIPTVISKMGNVYVDDNNSMMFVDTESAEGKFLWFGYYNGEYDMVLTKGQQKPDGIEAYLIDGAEGTGETVTLNADNFTEFDTSVTGETTVTVTYENAEYRLSCRVYEDGEYTPPQFSIFENYRYLGITDEAYEALPKHITPGTTAEEYFANYKGENAMFYYGDNIPVSKEQVTVEHWMPDKTDGTRKIFYRVKVVIDGITYSNTGIVHVSEEGNDEKGFFSPIQHNNDDIAEVNGIWYVPKGTSLDGITAEFITYTQNFVEDVTLKVFDYQPFKLGAQVITLSYGESEIRRMVYVYDDSNVILMNIGFEGLKLDGEGKVDLAEAKIVFVDCDGSTRKVDVAGYMDSISVDGNTVTFRYNAIVDNVKYPFIVTETVLPTQQ